MIPLPERAAKETESPIGRRVLVTLNRIPGVRAVRNNAGRSPCACRECAKRLCRSCAPRLTRPIDFGLGYGSPDIQCRYALATPRGLLPFVFWIEVKRPGRDRTSKERRELQEGFRAEAESRGELSAVVTSELEATIAAHRIIAEYKRRHESTVAASYMQCANCAQTIISGVWRDGDKPCCSVECARALAVRRG